MSVRQTIKRYTKIISLLRLRPMSFKEIQAEMEKDPDAVEENLTTSIRTMQRDIKAIASIYDIEIKNDPKTSKYYIVEDVEDLPSKRLRENFEILNAIRMSRGFGDSLVFEERRSLGTEHMAGLLHAIQNKLFVSFSYEKFWDDSIRDRKVAPVALKESRNRWYLIGRDENDQRAKNFALDRIGNLFIEKSGFEPIPYDVEKEFKDCFGIINGTNEEATEIILSFTPEQGRYVESLPLHPSQSLISKSEEEFQFRYYIRPTYDFKMEILSYGNKVKVIEPKEFKEEIVKNLRATLSQY
ncbi:WYL domain-containing protein [Pontixanthobacter gangjinensis]|uniref:WYL domain-containing protein n=1 Tax=Christiangramia aestuarii TaxID=1028746 RepID=A0A7K1LMK9_9FLAO|nr:WYL domain-containing protein [Christiangramia aestuarii]MUP42045.1 WYL domain-containing protein [Christiangramia aestuarii]